MDKKKGVRFN